MADDPTAYALGQLAGAAIRYALIALLAVGVFKAIMQWIGKDKKDAIAAALGIYILCIFFIVVGWGHKLFYGDLIGLIVLALLLLDQVARVARQEKHNRPEKGN